MGCSNTKRSNGSTNITSLYKVNIINQSDEKISEIRHEERSSGGGAINTDGSLIAKSEVFQLSFSHPIKSINLSILDEKNDILLSKTMTLDFNDDYEATLEIIPTKNELNFIHTTSPILSLFPLPIRSN